MLVLDSRRTNLRGGTAVMKHAIVTFTILCGLAICALGGGPPAPQDETVNVDSYIESLRADYRAGKINLISQAMHFNDKESAAFWPIYRRYEAEVTTLNDGRVALIKTYAEKFATLTDAEAKALVEKSFTLESSRIELKKKYFKEFSKALPALTVAKFFQLEYRLDLLANVQIASELPLLAIRSNDNTPSQGTH